MVGLPFPGGTPTEELHKHIRIGLMVMECINNYMSKDETQRYLQSRYQFARQDINEAWGLLERKNPDSLRLHNERIRERNLRTCERVASSSPREGTSAIQGEQEKQRLSPPPPPSARRPLWNSPNVQRYAAQVPQEAANNANALENQNLQASPAYPNDFWQQFLNTLDQIQSKTQCLSTLPKIQSDTDQMVELLTDGHGFGPHPSAAGSSKRQRLGEAEERGGDGET
ncbi:unnamed protein product [Brassica rapa]|uniref:Uncharacterized protein n=1 Tax=Brassica campestris TaxID=3711 RepID=A0A3P6AHI9_BRACM|nr:unnamed protein product [Brassica rapa]VDC91047.1 unnamed protein product [Brassica rapa]